MFIPFGFESFQSIWYWAVTVLVWTLVCQRTLGVPQDMLLRADRLPQVADRVDLLAGITAERLTGLHSALGVPLAAFTGFALAALAALGLLTGIEAAQALFVLLAPLTVVAIASFRLALVVRRTSLTGAALRRRLVRRRIWNQVIAALAILWGALLAAAQSPRAMSFY